MPPDADHFQVSWHNLSYAIKHQTGCYERARRNIAKTVDVASKLFKYSPSSRSYNLKESSHIEDGPKEDITILRRSNGSFRSGQLTAVMGPSGAGKTSLLNFVTRRQHEGFTGNLIVSQAKRKMVTINAIAQTDHLAEYLTVRENLAFASRLKNPTMSSKDHDQNVARVSNLLGLNKCLETRTKQISGGQQKRLAIAQELLSKPDILILDEPTSGLDSLTCLNTLTVLKDLVKASADKIIEPIAIVLTIHQPQREAFELFDKVYVMATGGVVIYDGPPSKCKEFIDTYSGLEMPEGYNPASFLIEIASGQFGEKPIEAMYAQVERKFIADHSGSMERASKLEEICGGLYVDPHLVKGSNRTGDGHFLAKTLTLAKRCTLGTVREPNLFFLRLFIHISIPMTVFVMMGSEPGKANACPKLSDHYELQRMAASDEYTNVERQKEYLLTLENVLMLYNMVYACVITKIGIMSLVFILDMRSSLKEFNNGWYSMNAYLLARVLADLPMDLILPTITFTLTYWLTGQVTGVEGGDLDAIYRILLTSFVTFVGSSIGQMVGMTLGAIYLDDVGTALFVSQAVSLPLVMISGVVVKTREMSPLVGFFSQLSVFRHCLDVTYIIRYGFNLCGCCSGSQDIQFVGSDNVTMTGVPEAFRSFTKLWVNSQAEESSPKAGDNSTTTNEVDVFELIAKQVSQYNTYGVDVKSCKELVPFQMYDFNLSERDLPSSFQALLGLHLVTAVALVLVVNLLVRHKSSL